MKSDIYFDGLIFDAVHIKTKLDQIFPLNYKIYERPSEIVIKSVWTFNGLKCWFNFFFILQLKLTEVETIELLDKRGYLTICINLLKDGKIYLRRPEGIREWFAALQVRSLTHTSLIEIKNSDGSGTPDRVHRIG